VDKQENQHLLDLPRIIAVGIASPAGAALTSRFGVTGTLVGLALSAVIIAVVSDLLKVYLQRLPGAVTIIAGRSRTREAGRRSASRSRSLFSKLASLTPAQRRSTLIRWVVGIGLAFIIGLGVVTTVEASVGKNLSCWLWHNCPTTSSSEGEASNTSTLPSILSGGSSASTTASQASTSNPTTKLVAPSPPPSSTPAASPTSPSSPPPPPASSSGSETPSTSSPPSSSSYQQEGSSSTSESKQGTSEEGYKQSSSETSGDHQQQQQQSKYRQSTDKPGGQHQQAQ